MTTARQPRAETCARLDGPPHLHISDFTTSVAPNNDKRASRATGMCFSFSFLCTNIYIDYANDQRRPPSTRRGITTSPPAPPALHHLVLYYD